MNNCTKNYKILGDLKDPLVSVLVFNYNYGRYLRECLDSILEQTYKNIEICFSDNASEDDSWNIALKYYKKYPEIINLSRNRINFGSNANILNCINSCRGKYLIEMCSDDKMAPEFIEKCVRVLEDNAQCAYAMVSRGIIDECGNLKKEPPFYNKSCIIKGDEQAAVYMMAAVNPSVSQVMYVSSKFFISGREAAKVLASRWYGNRILDFDLCCKYSMAFIAEPLLLHRLHGENDSLRASENLLEIIGPFLLHHQFADTARNFMMKKPYERLSSATEKLSSLCLRYCTRFLINGDESIAEQYFHLAIALSLEVKKTEIFKNINQYWNLDDAGRNKIVKKLKNEANLVSRKTSYDPPPGSVEIDVEKLVSGK